MNLSALARPTAVIRAGTTIRDFFAACVDHDVQGLPFVDGGVTAVEKQGGSHETAVGFEGQGLGDEAADAIHKGAQRLALGVSEEIALVQDGSHGAAPAEGREMGLFKGKALVEEAFLAPSFETGLDDFELVAAKNEDGHGRNIGKKIGRGVGEADGELGFADLA